MTESKEDLQKIDNQNRPADGAHQPAEQPKAERRWFRYFRRNKTVIAQPATTDEEHRAAERDYWRRSLRKQRNLNIITFLAAVAGLSGIWVLWGTLKATKDQASAAKTQTQTAQQEFELSERPWVSADPIQFSDLTFDKTAGHFTIRFLLKNTGHSPAAHTHIEAQLIPIKFDQIFKEPLERQKQLCDAARNRTTSSEFAAFTLFPSGQTMKDAGMSMAQADIANAEFRPPNTKERPFIVPVIVGCVDYQFEFKSGHHQTRFLYELYRFEGKNRAWGRIYPGQNLPVSKLIFEPFAFGGSYAD
jgi:hypothetical protein